MSEPIRPLFRVVGKAATAPTPTPLDHQLDHELSAAITAALPSATTSQLIAVLTLLEIPDAMDAPECLITALLRGAR
jgi:hypothetical protein